MVSEAVLERVERGAAWLDKEYPGWEGRIDLDNLHMHDCERCVIGQLTGDYWAEASRRKWWEIDADALGFYNMRGEDPRTYRELESAWRALILSRRVVVKAALQSIADTIAFRDEVLPRPNRVLV